jgi:SAM-dependent methyltransferase
LLTEADLLQPEPTFPLDVVFCPRCTLVQITETVPSEQLFREYVYRSSFSSTMLQQAERLASDVVASRNLGSESMVVEVASNDGYLLQYYLRAGVTVLGIEPAQNIAKIAREEAGIATISEFFGLDLARKLRSEGIRADVIHANNVLAHVPDPNGFVAGIRELLKQSGVAIFEVPYVMDLIDNVEFDTIYHEHLSYFSVTSLVSLLARHGLAVESVERLPIHGGSLRLVTSRANSVTPGPSVEALAHEEKIWGVSKLVSYQHFKQRVEQLRRDTLSLIADLRAQGSRIAVYGASAKGSTLLNYCGLGRDSLEYVVDRNTLKQGRYTPGSHLLIEPTQRLMQDLPDYVLLLTWNFAEEILREQQAYRLKGGRFIIPIPKLSIV